LKPTRFEMVFIVFRERTFFHFDLAGLRGHDCKLFKKIFRLDVRKFSFSKQVVDNWTCAPYVNSGTINRFKKHISVQLEPETVN